MTHAYKNQHILSSKEVLKLQENKKNSKRTQTRGAHGDKRCTTLFSSATSAMKAQGILALNGIQVNVIKTSGSHRSSGCGFGISYACTDNDEIRRILDEHGMSADTLSRERQR